jgi:hypothetical protein
MRPQKYAALNFQTTLLVIADEVIQYAYSITSSAITNSVSGMVQTARVHRGTGRGGLAAGGARPAAGRASATDRNIGWSHDLRA